MKKYILFAVAIAAISITSCRKIETSGQKEIIVINGGGSSTTGGGSSTTGILQNMIGTTWVITGMDNGHLNNPIAISDTLKFETITNYKYNNIPYTYWIYVTNSVYNLTMNCTPWGNLTGSVNDNNITLGLIEGIMFTDISLGSSNNQEYYLWIKKI